MGQALRAVRAPWQTVPAAAAAAGAMAVHPGTIKGLEAAVPVAITRLAVALVVREVGPVRHRQERAAEAAGAPVVSPSIRALPVGLAGMGRIWTLATVQAEEAAAVETVAA